MKGVIRDFCLFLRLRTLYLQGIIRYNNPEGKFPEKINHAVWKENNYFWSDATE